MQKYYKQYETNTKQIQNKYRTNTKQIKTNTYKNKTNAKQIQKKYVKKKIQSNFKTNTKKVHTKQIKTNTDQKTKLIQIKYKASTKQLRNTKKDTKQMVATFSKSSGNNKTYTWQHFFPHWAYWQHFPTWWQ